MRAIGRTATARPGCQPRQPPRTLGSVRASPLPSLRRRGRSVGRPPARWRRPRLGSVGILFVTFVCHRARCAASATATAARSADGYTGRSTSVRPESAIGTPSPETGSDRIMSPIDSSTSTTTTMQASTSPDAAMACVTAASCSPFIAEVRSTGLDVDRCGTRSMMVARSAADNSGTTRPRSAATSAPRINGPPALPMSATRETRPVLADDRAAVRRRSTPRASWRG